MRVNKLSDSYVAKCFLFINLRFHLSKLKKFFSNNEGFSNLKYLAFDHLNDNH